MIKKIKITNFRKFEDLELRFKKNLVIITGDNTKGKSTVLEALHLITSGEGGYDFDDLSNTKQKDEEKFLRIEITDEDGKEYSLFKDCEKKELRVDGRKTIPRKFYEKISSVLFSPDQIDLLMVSGAKRREFLDKLICSLSYQYGDDLSKMNKALKQRNAYLKRLARRFYESGNMDITDSQLIYWTGIFAKYAVMIMKKRDETIEKLKTDMFEISYKPSIVFNLFEDMQNEKDTQDLVASMIMEKARKDIALGYSNLGPHRDDFAIFRGKDIKRFGSRGEKRVAIGKLIFLSLELKAEILGFRPILLLDDIPSELDKVNTKEILNDGILDKQQTIITTIDITHIPKEILKKAQIIDLNSIKD
ncbi:DNA replication and repair protein RecF [Candidatus Dojkabacteria bacterium]|jgi:DNA replication and repair protein RecF|nr:DNA replication and repair protein RecF [Candidatus Dojkabacteria bacterium]